MGSYSNNDDVENNSLETADLAAQKVIPRSSDVRDEVESVVDIDIAIKERTTLLRTVLYMLIPALLIVLDILSGVKSAVPIIVLGIIIALLFFNYRNARLKLPGLYSYRRKIRQGSSDE